MAIKPLRLAAIILVTVSTTVTLIGCTSSFNAAGPPPASAAASASGHNCMPNFASGFDSRFAQVNGQAIHYWIGGTGPVLVLLHGYPEDGYTWHEVAPQLAATHTVIVPDLRGFGQSSRPETGYTTGELSEDVYQLITSLGYRQVDVAGHDWGGAVAYALAAAHRDSVRRMANLEAGAPPGFGQEAAQNQNPQLFWFVWLARAPAAESITDGREAEYLTPLYRDFSYNKIGISDSQLDGYLCCFRQPGADARRVHAISR
jgi:pimeloyl-ACP methyl ester carboxylesterase